MLLWGQFRPVTPVGYWVFIPSLAGAEEQPGLVGRFEQDAGSLASIPIVLRVVRALGCGFPEKMKTIEAVFNTVSARAIGLVFGIWGLVPLALALVLAFALVAFLAARSGCAVGC